MAKQKQSAPKNGAGGPRSRRAPGWRRGAAVSPTMAKALNLPGATGVLVAEVQKDSPASSAGIQPGDVITKIGSQSVKNPRALAQIVAALCSGFDQETTVRRDGQDKTLTVAVAAQPDQDTTVQSAAAEQASKLGRQFHPAGDLLFRRREGFRWQTCQVRTLPDGPRPSAPTRNDQNLQNAASLDSTG